jgi:hypothetical protein
LPCSFWQRLSFQNSRRKSKYPPAKPVALKM